LQEQTAALKVTGMTHINGNGPMPKEDIARIIAVFGGTGRGSVLRMAKLLDIPASTIYTWQRTGDIPSHRQRELLASARRRGLSLSPEDFFPDCSASAS
jgi:hypothetical protein